MTNTHDDPKGLCWQIQNFNLKLMLPLLLFFFNLFFYYEGELSVFTVRLTHQSQHSLENPCDAWRCNGVLFFITSYMFDKKHIYVGTWCAFTFCTLSTEQWTILTRSNIKFPAPFLNWSIKSFSCFGKSAFMIHSWRGIGCCTIFNSDDLTEPRLRGWFYLSFCLIVDMNHSLFNLTDNLEALVIVEFITQTLNLWREFWRWQHCKKQVIGCGLLCAMV